MNLPIRTKRYLDNKKQGGFINERGNIYENYYAVFHMLQNTNKYYANLTSIIYSSQEDAFIDDLLVIENGNRFLYQLKTSKTLSWGSSKIKTLKFDFTTQKKIEAFNATVFELGLVVSFTKLRKNLENKIPTVLKKCTKIIYFPYNNTLSKQITNHKKFRSELTSLTYMNNPPSDKLEALASCILGYWQGSGKKNVSLADIIDKVEKVGYSFIKPRVINSLSIATKAILNTIKDFTYLEAGGYFAWTYQTTDSGIIPYQIGTAEFNKIENDIQANNPTNFTQLEILIS